MSNPPNKLSRKAKIRLGYYRVRLQVSKFFDRFSRGSKSSRTSRGLDLDEDELFQETSFSEPALPRCSSIPIIMPMHHGQPSNVSNRNDQQDVNNNPRQSFNLQGHDQIHQRTISGRFPVRTVSSEDDLRRSRKKRSTSGRKRRSSRTRSRQALNSSTSDNITGDYAQDDDYDGNKDKRETEAERISDVQHPEVHEATGGLSTPDEDRTITPRELREIPPFRPNAYMRLPQPPVIEPRSLQPQSYQRHQEVQPKSILKQNAKPSVLSREIQEETIQRFYQYGGPRTRTSASGDMKPMKSDLQTSSNSNSNAVSFGKRILSLANRRRDPSVYEKEPVLLRLGFKFVYQTKPSRQKDIEKAKTKAAVQETRLVNHGYIQDPNDPRRNPTAAMFLISKLIPKWLKDDNQPEVFRNDSYGRGFVHGSTTLRSNPGVMFPRSILKTPTPRPVIRSTTRATTLVEPAKKLEPPTPVGYGHFGFRKPGQSVLQAHHELRPQNYQVYGPTTIKNKKKRGSDNGEPEGYQPKSAFTYQFTSLLNKKKQFTFKH